MMMVQPTAKHHKMHRTLIGKNQQFERRL